MVIGTHGVEVGPLVGVGVNVGTLVGVRVTVGVAVGGFGVGVNVGVHVGGFGVNVGVHVGGRGVNVAVGGVTAPPPDDAVGDGDGIGVTNGFAPPGAAAGTFSVGARVGVVPLLVGAVLLAVVGPAPDAGLPVFATCVTILLALPPGAVVADCTLPKMPLAVPTGLSPPDQILLNNSPTPASMPITPNPIPNAILGIRGPVAVGTRSVLCCCKAAINSAAVW